MSVYVIAQLKVHDPDEYQKYLAGFLPVFRRHGGKLIARSPEAAVIEGSWTLPRTLIMQFPTAEDAQRWHHDPDYLAIAAHRQRAAECNIVLVEGVPG
jgi:uncharacterized protein (DUF1330 family)